MAERLTSLDASFLYLEEPGTPLHVAGVLVLESPTGGLEALAALVEARLPLVPRYRRRVLPVPGHLADPVWADDADFDPGYHVRRSALPRPGGERQLLALVSRVTSRPLDTSRPLREMYLVEGLAGGRRRGRDQDPPGNRGRAQRAGHRARAAGGDPGDVGARARAVAAAAGAGTAGAGVAGARGAGGAPDRRAGRGALGAHRRPVDRRTRRRGGHRPAAGRRSAAFAAPPSPLNETAGPRRRVAVARIDLADVRKVRTSHGGTVNDVLLTVVTGALREWLLSRGRPVVTGTSVRALVPVSLEDGAAPGGQVASHLVDLPVGEPNPRVRLARIGYAMRTVGSGVGAGTLAALSGFAPPTLHALGVRAARGLSRRLFNLVVTNVPGPQVPLYAAGGRVLEVFPVVPLVRGQGLSVGMTSYDGRVFVGLNADAESVADVDLLADLVEQELGELLAGTA